MKQQFAIRTRFYFAREFLHGCVGSECETGCWNVSRCLGRGSNGNDAPPPIGTWCCWNVCHIQYDASGAYAVCREQQFPERIVTGDLNPISQIGIASDAAPLELDQPWPNPLTIPRMLSKGRGRR